MAALRPTCLAKRGGQFPYAEGPLLHLWLELSTLAAKDCFSPILLKNSLLRLQFL